VGDCYVYIVTNKNRSTLYIGVTNELARRLEEHRTEATPGFSSDYSLSILLYYEIAPDPRSAIAREKQLKGWRRKKKVKLIEAVNPRWLDLSAGLYQPEIVRGPSTPPAKPGCAQDDFEDDGAAAQQR
jgi:putative endonuclease